MGPPPQATRRLPPDLGYPVALVALVAWVLRPLVRGESFLGGDMVPFNLPQFRLIAEVWCSGSFPGWAPQLGLGRPLVAAGRGHPLSAAILRRLVDVPAWAMPNLIAGERIVPEFLQQEAQPERVAQALAELIVDGPARARQLEGLDVVRERLGGGATARVCRIAEEMLGSDRA